MKQIIHSQYARFFFAGLVLIIISAWFSIGFYHADEYVQVLEFASWKMGFTPATAMPWEYYEHIRASLLPYIVVFISKLLQLLKLYNPFIVTFLLRLFTGAASWFITCLVCLQLGKNIRTEKGKKLFILVALFLWYVPFLSVRYTTENISGILFLYGFYILLRALETEKKSALHYFVAGFLFGISFFIRAPLLIAVVGLTAWLIKIKKVKWKYLLTLYAGFIIAIILNTGMDCLFYDEPVFSLFNYIQLYITHSLHGIHGMEANSWWFYIEQFAGRIIPPFSLFLLAAFVVGAYKNRKDPLVWVIIPFIIILSIIRHKELRFLFPVSFIFIYITVLGIDYLLTKSTYLKWHKYIYAAFVLVAIPLLIIRTLLPANISVSYCQYIYNNVHGKNVPLISIQDTNHANWNPLSSSLFFLQNNYDYSFLMTNRNFYKNPAIRPVPITDITKLNSFIDSVKPETVYYLDKSGEDSLISLDGYQIKECYSFSPSWMKDFIAWICDDKAARWKIYKITKGK